MHCDADQAKLAKLETATSALLAGKSINPLASLKYVICTQYNICASLPCCDTGHGMHELTDHVACAVYRVTEQPSGERKSM